jgi:hypothetical protein
MENAKKARGRPKKEEGREEFWRFVRAGMIAYAYNEARKRKQKHSAAVREAVAYIRQHRPEMPVSETVVKRTLATLGSRSDPITLRFQRFTVGKKKLVRLQSVLKLAHDLQREMGLPVPLSIQNLPRSLMAYKFGFAKRPRYPRHNRKNQKL